MTMTLDDITRNITARNAENRNSLLPKDNSWVPPLEANEQGEYS